MKVAFCVQTTSCTTLNAYGIVFIVHLICVEQRSYSVRTGYSCLLLEAVKRVITIKAANSTTNCDNVDL